MVLIKPNTTAILHGVTKQISKLTFWDLKLSRTNHAHTCSSTQIVKAIIKLTLTNVFSRSITSTGSGTWKSIKNFTKVENSQFIQMWTALKHDYEENQDLLSKYLKERTTLSSILSYKHKNLSILFSFKSHYSPLYVPYQVSRARREINW